MTASPSGHPRPDSPHPTDPRAGSPRSDCPRAGHPRAGSPSSGSPSPGSPQALEPDGIPVSGATQDPAGDATAWHRLHPLSPLVSAGRHLVTIAILVLILFFANRRGTDSELVSNLVLVAVVLAAGVVSWLVTRWQVAEGVLRIETGLIRRESRRFPLSQIQAIDLAQTGAGAGTRARRTPVADGGRRLLRGAPGLAAARGCRAPPAAVARNGPGTWCRDRRSTSAHGTGPAERSRHRRSSRHRHDRSSRHHRSIRHGQHRRNRQRKQHRQHGSCNGHGGRHRRCHRSRLAAR